MPIPEGFSGTAERPGGVKLIVQIPCHNEEATLPQTVADIPYEIAGVDRVEILVIDDGSTDRTVEVARKIGVDHIVRHRGNRGLARTYRTGIDTAVRLGADIIVNTDGDNQYAGGDIPKLIGPILRGEADIVVGDRQTDTIAHFSPVKKRLQRVGSRVIGTISGVPVPDAVSGFRAISRDAAVQMNIVSSFSYTIEMLIQAGKKRLAVAVVPVATNPKTRESRLFRSVPRFLKRSLTTLVRIYAMYEPLKVFFVIGFTLTALGVAPMVRFLFFYFSGQGAGHLQSLVIGGALLVIGFVTFLIGLVADLVGHNRQLLEMTLEKVRRLEIAVMRGEGPRKVEAGEPESPGSRPAAAAHDLRRAEKRG